MLLFKAGALASLLVLFSSCSKHETFEWKLQSHASESSVDYKELITFAKNLEIMSQGRFKISVHPGGEIAGGAQIFNAVQTGKIEMGNGWPNWWSAQHPAWAVMNAGPYDFMNLDASMIFFLAGDGLKLANKLSEEKGIVWRPAWWPGMEFGLLSKTPIRTLSDLKGKKVRIGPGLPSEVLTEASGSYSIPIVPSEIRPALKSDELDAVEWTTANGILELGLDDLASHAIVPAIWQPSVVSDFLINKAALEKLPQDLKVMLETAIKAYNLTTTLKAKALDIQSLDKLKAKGVKINKWKSEDLAIWRKASDKIYKKYKSEDAFSKEYLNSKQSFKKEYNKYYEYFGPYDREK